MAKTCVKNCALMGGKCFQMPGAEDDYGTKCWQCQGYKTPACPAGSCFWDLSDMHALQTRTACLSTVNVLNVQTANDG